MPHLLRALAVPGELVGLAQPTVEVAEAVGCARCRNTGYLGRGGIYEVMPIDDEIRSMIVARAAAQEIARVAVANGMRRLRDDGLEKVRTGLTTLSELVRVLG